MPAPSSWAGRGRGGARRVRARARRGGAARGRRGPASEQFARALELLGRLSIPYDHAEIELRAGVALARAGDRTGAVDRLTDAYRIARRLGARPLAAAAAEALQGLGERVDVRLGRARDLGLL